MASREFIEKRIEGKKKELGKLRKKLERILKAQASGWEDNPYWYREDDIRYTNRDIAQAEEALAGYEAELETESRKAASRNVPAITEFLDGWYERCLAYYAAGLTEAHKLYDDLHKLHDETEKFRYGTPEYEAANKKYLEARDDRDHKMYGYYEPQEYESYGKKRTRQVKVRDGELEYVKDFMERTYEESIKKVEKALKQEYDRKYDFIIDRTLAIVGTITDASGLSVGDKGDLNGRIIGTDGIAKVNTFGAGGYNIQCYHFRTTIKPMK